MGSNWYKEYNNMIIVVAPCLCLLLVVPAPFPCLALVVVAPFLLLIACGGGRIFYRVLLLVLHCFLGRSKSELR